MDVVTYVISIAIGNFVDYKKNLKLANIIYDRNENYIW